MRRLLVILLLLGFTSLLGTSHRASAQDERVKTIPILGGFTQIRLSPDGHTVAIFELGIMHEGEIVPELLPVRLYDLATFETTQVFTEPSDYASEAVFNSDGSRLMTYHENGDMFIWDAATGSLLNQITALPAVNSRALFYGNSAELVMVCQPNMLMLCEWDTETDHLTRILRPRYATRNDFLAQFENGPAPFYVALTLSADGEQIAAASAYGTIDVWDVTTGERLELTAPTEFPLLNIMSLAFIHDDEQIIYYNTDTELIHIIDARNGSEVRSFPAGFAGAPRFALAPDGDHIAYITGEREAPVVNVVSLSDADEPLVIDLPLPADIVAQPRQVSMYFTPDGQMLVVGGFSNTVDVENVIYLVDVRR